MNKRFLLLRYDVESTDAEAMTGFLAQMVTTHRRDHLPVTLFCTGAALDARTAEFQALQDSVGDDPLFEIGDHSYSHIGVGYAAGKSVAILRADYERSFDTHERVLGTRPVSLSLCGTGGKDGERLSGFDATPKAREELAMLAGLGVRRLNTFLSTADNSRDFIDFASLGFPDVQGFPSAFSDTGWLWRAEAGTDFLAPLRAEIDRRSDENAPMPVVLHDWVTWRHAPDQALTHVSRISEYARSQGFELHTLRDAVALAQGQP